MYCRPSNSRYLRSNRESGAALVVALLVFALSASLVVAMRAEFNRYFTRSANLLMAEQAYAYLRGAEDLAAMVLIADFDLDQQNKLIKDDLNEEWAGPARPFLLDEGGWLRGEVEDLNRRFNINTLLKRPPPPPTSGQRTYSSEQKQFIRLLQALGEPQVSESDARLITDSIIDWIDADQQPLPQGAEDDYYFGKEPPHRTPNSPMTSTSELLSVAYMTPDIYRALRPYITVWPLEADEFKINVHTASAMILRTINEDENFNPLSESEGQDLIDYRDEQGFVDVDDFLKRPVFGTNGKTQWAKTVLQEDSDHFLLRADVEVGERNMRLYSVLFQDTREVVTLVRSSGDL